MRIWELRENMRGGKEKTQKTLGEMRSESSVVTIICDKNAGKHRGVLEEKTNKRGVFSVTSM